MCFPLFGDDVCCSLCGGLFFEDPDGSLMCNGCSYSIRADGSPDTSYMDDDDIKELIGVGAQTIKYI